VSKKISTARIRHLVDSLEGTAVHSRDAAALTEILQAIPVLLERYDWIERMKADRDPYTQDALRRGATWIEFRLSPGLTAQEWADRCKAVER
jgi:hypothetical protein